MSSLALAVLLALFVPIIWLVSKHWPLNARTGQRLLEIAAPPDSVTDVLTIGTYNIHRGRGLDGKRDLTRIAKVISGCDIVALQEVEGHGLRHLGNQAYMLGQACGYSAHFSPTRRQLFFPHRGNALLTRLPVTYWRREPLSPTTGKAYRNVTIYKIEVNGHVIHVLNTHLSKPSEQSAPLGYVIELFLSLERAVLVGDFNARQTEPKLRELLASNIEDATALCCDDPDRIDWILVRGIEVVSARSQPPGASDHPFFCATLRLR